MGRNHFNPDGTRKPGGPQAELRLAEERVDGQLVRRRWYRGEQLVRDMTYGERETPVGIAREWFVTGELRRERHFPEEGGSCFRDVTYAPDGRVRHIRT